MQNQSRVVVWVVLGFAFGALTTQLLQQLRREPAPDTPHRSSDTPHLNPNPPTGVTPVPVASAKDDGKETWRQAQRERAKGNYILDSDIPWVQERLAARDRGLIEQLMAERGPAYDMFLSELGMSAREREQALHHISLIYQAKLDARKSMTTLMQAQMDYEIRMRRVLGDRFKEYSEYESMDRAREESLRIARFAESSGLALSPDRAQALNSLIQQTSSYTLDTLGGPGGPKDEVQPPRYGQAVVPMLEEYQASLSLGSTSLLESARQMGFTATELKVLESYFQQEVLATDQRIIRATSSVEGQIGVLERRLVDLRAKNADPRLIESYEGQLATLRRLRRAGPGG